MQIALLPPPGRIPRDDEAHLIFDKGFSRDLMPAPFLIAYFSD